MSIALPSGILAEYSDSSKYSSSMNISKFLTYCELLRTISNKSNKFTLQPVKLRDIKTLLLKLKYQSLLKSFCIYLSKLVSIENLVKLMKFEKSWFSKVKLSGSTIEISLTWRKWWMKGVILSVGGLFIISLLTLFNI